jgi:putative oxidoreductase
MKIATLIARILLGFGFFAIGLIAILKLGKPQPMTPDATEFLRILTDHRYTIVIGLIETVAGLLLLVGRFVPLALTLLGPILVNILMFHLLIMPAGIAAGLVFTALEVFLIVIYRKSFYTLFHPAPEVF